MQKRTGIVLAIGAVVLGILIICSVAWIQFMRQPSTRIALLLWDGMSEDGVIQNMLSMRQDSACLAQCSSTLQMELPLIGAKEFELSGQLDESGLKFYIDRQPEKVYLYDFREKEKQGILVRLLGQETTEKLDHWLSVIGGDAQKGDTEYMSVRGKKLDYIFLLRDLLSDLDIREMQVSQFYVDGQLGALKGYTISITKEELGTLWEEYAKIAGESAKAVSSFDPEQLIDDGEMQISLYYQGDHLAAMQFSCSEGTMISLHETENGLPEVILRDLPLGSEVTLDMEICYLPKEQAKVYPDVTADIGNLDLGQLPGLFLQW